MSCHGSRRPLCRVVVECRQVRSSVRRYRTVVELQTCHNGGAPPPSFRARSSSQSGCLLAVDSLQFVVPHPGLAAVRPRYTAGKSGTSITRIKGTNDCP
jgi:hypothetical protein